MKNENIYRAELIKNAMEDQKLTFQDVADKSGVSRPTIYDIIDGKPTVKVETLSDVATALGVSLNDLFADKEQLELAA